MADAQIFADGLFEQLTQDELGGWATLLSEVLGSYVTPLQQLDSLLENASTPAGQAANAVERAIVAAAYGLWADACNRLSTRIQTLTSQNAGHLDSTKPSLDGLTLMMRSMNSFALTSKV